ncbi:MAG TPA: GNAT family N-acetyltransferase [Bacillaceae bacterium]
MEVRMTRDHELVANLNKPVHDLHVKLYPEFFKDYDLDCMKTVFQGLMEKENNQFLLLMDEGEPIGYAWIEVRNCPENIFKKGYTSLYVHQISILESHRKKGGGVFLMKNIYKMAKSKEVDLIELDYWTDNEVAKRFYTKEGFKVNRAFLYKRI